MKLLELEIRNIRGIRELSLKPNGKSFVIWGPNGSGKSTVVDAIDFLLTGRIQRLTGSGTGGITLKRHGPHIDTTPTEAVVRALVKLPKISNPIEIKRCIDDPGKLICDESVEIHLETITNLAKRGQHVLTRRELLKYVTSEAGQRAQEIQALLGITEIESIRKSLVRVRSNTQKDVQATSRSFETAKGYVNATTGQKKYLEKEVINFVNQNRAILGAPPISTLNVTKLKEGITPFSPVSTKPSVNITMLERDINNLKQISLKENQDEIAQNDQQLRSAVKFIRDNPDLRRAYKLQNLTQMGLELIDDSGNCPLCDANWPPGKLAPYLRDRLSQARVADGYRKKINDTSKIIVNRVNTLIPSLKKVIATARAGGLEQESTILGNWLEMLQNLSEILSDPVNLYLRAGLTSDNVKNMFAGEHIMPAINNIYLTMKATYPKLTPEQTAWDTLTRLGENLRTLNEAETKLKHAQIAYKRSETLLDNFQIARDKVLGELYDSIRGRFEQLYQQLHQSDESEFKASLEHDGAGLSLEVDFHGRGKHPPHALHSEGHQDSMGLCLYLALAERLTKGTIDFIILDDVVMSVDADHRRELCRLLKTAFPENQFLITTHDKTWANQLKYHGVISSKGLTEFYNWNLETGPRVNYEADVWRKIQVDLEKNDIPSAAARLRRGSEDFYGQVCNALQAPVPYKLTGDYDLGILLSSAMGQYTNLLKKAKEAENSWSNKDGVAVLVEVEKIKKSIYNRISIEQWAVNPNVHYNSWANFLEPDFRPVVEAFQDLSGLFTCSGCGSLLELITQGIKPVGVRCKCGKVNWNLIKKRN